MEDNDIKKVIEYLVQRRDLIDTAISDLEKLSAGSLNLPKRAGRKFVDPEERQQISQRMKERWALRRGSVNGK